MGTSSFLFFHARSKRCQVTQIHGISEAHLESVTFTLRHAQAAMKKLVGPDTILVGHALDNDLKSLKFSHARVVDTALLFRSPEGKTCSLRELAVALLGGDQVPTNPQALAQAHSVPTLLFVCAGTLACRPFSLFAQEY